MFNRLISQLTRRSAAALPAENSQARDARAAATRAWLAADLFPSYAPELLFADPVRERVAGLIAARTDVELIEPLLDQLEARGAQPVDRMLRADAWLAAGAAARAEPLLAELAQLQDGIGARAAAILAQRLMDRGDYKAATPLLATARLAPNSAGVQTALAELLDFVGREAEALGHFQRALALRPDSALVVGQLACAYLARGELREGLSIWALADEINGAHAQADLCPVWDGRPLGSDSLLIVCGYGFGDILQFMRFALHLRAREAAARVSILVPPPLERLAAAMGCFASVHTSAPDRAVFDWQISLTRLPLALGLGMDDLLKHEPHLHIAAPEVAAAAGWLPPRRPGVLRVGLRWSGQAMPFDAKRSIPFEALRPLFGVPGVEWVALVENPALLAGLGAHPVRDVSAHLVDFYATGVLLQQLDLVISADTSVVHVAAGLGLPVWLLARPDPEWRWGLEGEATPWYASVRVLRHPPQGFDWDVVVGEAVRALRARVAS